ncbi:hypothetical protein NP493_1691g00038 [Ridgeia piscesae]|uniref:Uncharacterized protein n=1 Tax=Ridgeia piscesae TaxID=27915 RepID=A0AAD9N7A3_RIDPI|nr:hypothetical protein NP493_1691g00038 [Ridgeia piscesae]
MTSDLFSTPLCSTMGQGRNCSVWMAQYLCLIKGTLTTSRYVCG